ncbi:HAD family hydrolase [Paenibacillus methanolicus]|uniref:Phosphoglycolate phosphatase n=1 Tax=Paenibacillus methanolicus TaxID=582686 RepID=A0A5S5BUA5_9BACL|nr:HAD-IA family hydrolase [Paenibacillus methanolicus]TYP70755.1 phosphoglycolate phosphatase [Paenibacillus methanolicus]
MIARGIKGVIFDMDNTVLRSRIDFAAMKRAVADYLARIGSLPANVAVQEHTTATLLALAAAEAGLTPEGYEGAMRICAEHEKAGMLDADLEEGAIELLEALRTRGLRLAIVTNNAHEAAVEALERTGILPYFGLVVGREQMTSMKPHPSGYLAAKAHYADVPAQGWLSVGDSWIDARAACEANVPFVHYGASSEALDSRGIPYAGRIGHLRELLGYVEGE